MSDIYRNIKKISGLIFLIISVCIFPPKYAAKASHIMGGDMNYQYIGFDTITGMERYLVDVIFYRDMSGITCPASVSISIWEDDDGNPLTALNLSEILGSPVTFNQSSSQILIPAQSCFGDSSIVLPFDVELCTYTGIIEVPPNLFGYHITTGTCCRNAALDNLSPDNMTWYAFIPPTFHQNNSPVFPDVTFPYLCSGVTTSSPLYTGFDIDGDILIFSFSRPLNAPPAGSFSLPLDTATYQPGFNFSNPFGAGDYTNINALSGEGTFMAPNAGFYVVSVEIKEYRNTVLIGIVRREIPIMVIDCPAISCDYLISGTVFNDINANCVQDSAENPLANRLIKIDQGPYWTHTDNNGYYNIKVDTGTYTVSQIMSQYPYRELSCPSTQSNYTITFNYGSLDTISANNNFGNQPSIYCPLLTVDISTNILRSCFTNTYSIQYCNLGTADAANVYIEIDFGDYIFPMNSTIPWNTPQNGNIYTFDIGSLVQEQCGYFYITDSVSCNAVLGSTQCVEARIFPDTLCEPIDSTWDKSSIAVDGQCVGDSIIHFVIYNTGNPGTGDMLGTSEYRIYENNVLIQTQSFQLSGGDSLVIDVSANGNTFRLEADQRPGHPGNSQPQASIELCGTGVGGPITGFITQVPEDDQDLNIEIDCREITGSLDPNEKQVKPKGITINQYISKDDELEYQINFQNIGNDTASTVVIIDTLSDYLNIATLQRGTSSHPYTFTVYGQGILQWTFDNILLPDSNVNEPASHGFVKYKVKQTVNNPQGTIIENKVGIIFDFNAPVITNTTFNVVYDTTLTTSIFDTRIYINKIKIVVSPNPFTLVTKFKIIGNANDEHYSFYLYDLNGKQIKEINKIISNQFEIQKTDLPAGMYIYHIKSGSNLIGTGKLIVIE